MWCVNSDFFFNFRACTTSVLFYFTSIAKFNFTFLLLYCARPLPITVLPTSPSLFDLHYFLIVLHFTSSCSQSRERLFKRLHFRFERAFALKLSFFGFSSIFVCFNWFCYFIRYLFVLCGFGRVCLAELGSVRFWRHNFGLVVFSVLGVLLSSLKWLYWMFICMIRMLVRIKMFLEYVWSMFCAYSIGSGNVAFLAIFVFYLIIILWLRCFYDYIA